MKSVRVDGTSDLVSGRLHYSFGSGYVKYLCSTNEHRSLPELKTQFQREEQVRFMALKKLEGLQIGKCNAFRLQEY